jgi:CRP/FNR family cyclic AMP-dependent transcriptional regulator
MVFTPSSHPQSVYLLERGLVRIFRVSPSGSQTTFGYVNAGEIFGELAAFLDRPRESFAQAVQCSIVWRIAREALGKVIAAHPAIVAEVTKQVGTRLKRIESRVENLIFRDVRSRVACILLELAETFGRAESRGVTIDLPLSQEELATLVGATRQSVNATLRELRQEGFVARDRQRFVLTRPEALRHTLYRAHADASHEAEIPSSLPTGSQRPAIDRPPPSNRRSFRDPQQRHADHSVAGRHWSEGPNRR